MVFLDKRKKQKWFSPHSAKITTFDAKHCLGGGLVKIIKSSSSGSSGQVRGGTRNMKSMWPPLAAISQGQGDHGPLAPWIRYCHPT